MIGARVLCDSVCPKGVRLTTMEVTFPRFVLAEFNTHRVFSRNGASSRAIPTKKVRERVLARPVFPRHWGKNEKGMQASEEIPHPRNADQVWAGALQAAVEAHETLEILGVHKQIANRLLEPFMWQTMIVTATDWENFFHQRCHENTEPHLREAAWRMREAREFSTPVPVEVLEWHMPLLQPDERRLPLRTLLKLSVARCARVSYLTHEGQRDHDADLDLYRRLEEDGHWSPFEHVATPVLCGCDPTGNFRGWRPFRKEFVGENQDEPQARDRSFDRSCAGG